MIFDIFYAKHETAHAWNTFKGGALFKNDIYFQKLQEI